MPVFALTGNFGMGKTTVLAYFRKLGAHTINVDDLVQQILERPPVKKKIARLLGSGILTENTRGTSINRKRTADLIFHDSEKRHAVEQIIHPEVLKQINRIRSAILKRNPSAVIIFEIPLLFEAGYNSFFDNTIVVHSTLSTAMKRVVKKGFTEKDALSRMKAQMPITRKKKLADILIDNNGSADKTEKRVRQIAKKLFV